VLLSSPGSLPPSASSSRRCARRVNRGTARARRAASSCHAARASAHGHPCTSTAANKRRARATTTLKQPHLPAWGPLETEVQRARGLCEQGSRVPTGRPMHTSSAAQLAAARWGTEGRPRARHTREPCWLARSTACSCSGRSERLGGGRQTRPQARCVRTRKRRGARTERHGGRQPRVRCAHWRRALLPLQREHERQNLRRGPRRTPPHRPPGSSARRAFARSPAVVHLCWGPLCAVLARSSRMPGYGSIAANVMRASMTCDSLDPITTVQVTRCRSNAQVQAAAVEVSAAGPGDHTPADPGVVATVPVRAVLIPNFCGARTRRGKMQSARGAG